MSVFDYGFQALVIDILLNLLHLFGMDFLVRQLVSGKLEKCQFTAGSFWFVTRDCE